MSVDIFLSKLEKVKRTSKGKWRACCPAHGSKGPTLLVSERDDGSVGIHCFAGCNVHEVVSAVGLELSDLFPPRDDKHFVKGERRPFPAIDILRAIATESTLVLIAAADLLAGNPFNETDRARLALAAARIQASLTAGGIDHE
jgi:hypothetical protein